MMPGRRPMSYIAARAYGGTMSISHADQLVISFLGLQTPISVISSRQRADGVTGDTDGAGDARFRHCFRRFGGGARFFATFGISEC